MRLTVDQSRVLAEIERNHGGAMRVPDETNTAAMLLENCTTDARAYFCPTCHVYFTIELDGEWRAWVWQEDDDS